jgi:hypothetical protein
MNHAGKSLKTGQVSLGADIPSRSTAAQDVAGKGEGKPETTFTWHAGMKVLLRATTKIRTDCPQQAPSQAERPKILNRDSKFISNWLAELHLRALLLLGPWANCFERLAFLLRHGYDLIIQDDLEHQYPSERATRCASALGDRAARRC